MATPSIPDQDLFGRTALWLTHQGLGVSDLPEIVGDLGNRLVSGGVPVQRLSVGGMLLHPVFGAREVTWDGRQDRISVAHMPRAFVHDPDFQDTPFFQAAKQGLPFQRFRLEQETGIPKYRILARLRQEGITDYLVFYRDFGRRDMSLWEGLPKGVEGAVGSFATRRIGGFIDRQIELLANLADPLAMVVKSRIHDELSTSVLEAYLGSYSASHVLSGLIDRGSSRQIACALWYGDLRGSVGLAESMPADDYVALLNAYFECTAGAVADHGGEVLKYIGDAVMAIFPFDTDERQPPRMCGAAIDAAREAMARAERICRVDGAQPVPLEFGIAVHAGTVFYGNVGTERRLDFTVIGAAANETVRLESLCKRLGVPFLASEAFATLSDERLAPLGEHAVSGMDNRIAAFTLPHLATAVGGSWPGSAPDRPSRDCAHR